MHMIITTNWSLEGFGGVFLKAECRALLLMVIVSLFHIKIQRMGIGTVKAKNLIHRAGISE